MLTATARRLLSVATNKSQIGFSATMTSRFLKTAGYSTVVSTKADNLNEIVRENPHFDAIVIGAGIGGVAAALGVTTPQIANPLSTFEINENGAALRNLNVERPKRVLVIDAEPNFCFHSTGRSAAIFSEVYGSPSTQALSTATKPFLYAPRQMGLTDAPTLVGRRPNIWAATQESHEEMLALYHESRRLIPNLELLTPEQIKALVPWAGRNNDGDTARLAALQAEHAEMKEEMEEMGMYAPTPLTGGILEPDAADMDVDAIWHTLANRARQNGAILQNDVQVGEVTKGRNGSQSGWEIQLLQGTGSGASGAQGDFTSAAAAAKSVRISADIVINAGGAWADKVAEKFAVPTVGLVPKRRTVILFDPSEVQDDFPLKGDMDKYLHDQTSWPTMFCLNGRYYYKPDAGRVLASPEDETPSLPVDAQPEEEDVALIMHRLETLSYLKPERITGKWAGLRSFVDDGNFVIGREETSLSSSPAAAGDFYWLAALGGFGIQTCVGNARLLAGLVHQGKVPADMLANGLEQNVLSPMRYRK